MCNKNVLAIVVAAMLALATAANAKLMLISVNMDTTEREESTLDGPVDGDGGSDVGTTWNQIPVAGPGRGKSPVTATALKDSTNETTTVNCTITLDGNWAWGEPELVTLTSGLTNWVPTDPGDLVLSGLTPGVKYDLYLASFHPNENGGRTLFSTANTTTTVGTQIVDNGGPNGNDTTWVVGENYVLFENVVADGTGEIIVTIGSDWTTDNTKRFYLSGFQLTTSPTPVLAGSPNPEDEATDVPPDVVLSWEPGKFAAPTNGHKVYFGESFDDVNDATDAVAQTVASYAPAQRLDFGTTYYWRVDEVNAPPTSHVEFKGSVWSFTTEPIGYPIENVTATASSALPTIGPENTVNGSGMDADDLHSIEQADMWVSGSELEGAWIEFEFDRVYKLHEMLVWNSNQMIEYIIGFGCKGVAIEYSADGTNWTELVGVPEFAQAPGTPGYAHNTTIDFGGAAAKKVRLTISSNWGSLPQYSLSEVRFLYIPVLAREPQPESGAIDTDVDVTLSFRAGREAAEHNVYISADEQAVMDSTADVTSVTEASHGPISLDLGQTYYWKVNEVNDAETPTMWEGDIWNFTTKDSFVVEDFEDYNDYPGYRIYETWADGWEIPTNGAMIGYPEPLNFAAGDHILETTDVHSGGQSLPFFYDNSTAVSSEASVSTADLPIGSDWTGNGVNSLSLWFSGDVNNVPEQMYVKLNGVKALYESDASNLSKAEWQPFNINLTDFTGVDLSNVTGLSIGFERIGFSGGTGMVLFDDIRLLRLVTSDVPLITITVPNGDFEEIYKPGSGTITADLGDGWTNGVGPDTPMDGAQVATYSDGTTGTSVDVPGWIGAEGWENSYDWDPAFPNRKGSIARQTTPPDGLYYYTVNGGDWGNAQGGAIVSDAPLATVESGLTYTLSMLGNGSVTPVVLDLLADGVPLTPSSSVQPDSPYAWDEFSRTYDAATLDGFVGQALTIRLGVGPDASGTQSHFDAVSLSYVPEPRHPSHSSRTLTLWRLARICTMLTAGKVGTTMPSRAPG